MASGGRGVCISVDHSKISQETLAWAAESMLKPGDRVKIVSVMEPSVKSELAQVHAPAAARGTLDQVGWVVPLGNLRCEADPAVLEKTKSFLAECKQQLVAKGVPAAAIATEPLVACIGNSHDIGRQIIDASADCDSLIMGSRGLSLGKRTVMGAFGLGSVSDYVVKHAPCNVIVHKASKKQ